jgi:hypothetical protein
VLVGALVQRGTLGAAAGAEVRDSNAPVANARCHRNQPGGLERAQKPAQVAGVEPQPRAQQTHFAAVESDLPQQAGLAERSFAFEEAVVQRADALGDAPVHRGRAGRARSRGSRAAGHSGQELSCPRTWVALLRLTLTAPRRMIATRPSAKRPVTTIAAKALNL